MAATSIRLAWLRAFVAVAEELHFARAAARLYISAPTLSAQIRQLERQLDTALFIRSTRRVRLTAAGQRLLEEIRPALERIDQVLDEVHGVQPDFDDVLSVGFVSSLSRSLIPSATRRFHDTCPGARVRLIQASSNRQLTALRHESIDLALMWRIGDAPTPNDDLVAEALWRQRLFVALPADHSLVDRDEVTLADLSEERWLMVAGSEGGYGNDFVMCCREEGFVPRVRDEATTIDTMLGLVRAGLGVCTVPALVVDDYADALPFVPIGGRQLALVAMRRSATQEQVETYVDGIRRMAVSGSVGPSDPG